MDEADKYFFKYIYALVDPRTKQARYVGQTGNPKERLRHHIRNIDGTHEKYEWIRELGNEGLVPVIVLLEAIKLKSDSSIELPLVDERELAWMYGLYALGQPILNQEVQGNPDIYQFAVTTRLGIGWDIETSEKIVVNPND